MSDNSPQGQLDNSFGQTPKKKSQQSHWSRDHVEKVIGWGLIVQRLGANRPETGG